MGRVILGGCAAGWRAIGPSGYGKGAPPPGFGWERACHRQVGIATVVGD
jgi:hypothetical protein